jgi:hypothetical protein
MRIAIGEMRHLRAVNDVLRALAPAGAFEPALQVASVVPGPDPARPRPVIARRCTQQAIQDFIDIERPSTSVDGVYSAILATLERDGPHELEQTIRTVMAEGEDHFATFLAIQEWLNRHAEGDYLRSTTDNPPPPNDPDHRELQTRYFELLQGLYRGYKRGGAMGAPDVNSARMEMVGPIDAVAHAIAERGFVVVFDPITDKRFGPIKPPSP